MLKLGRNMVGDWEPERKGTFQHRFTCDQGRQRCARGTPAPRWQVHQRIERDPATDISLAPDWCAEMHGFGLPASGTYPISILRICGHGLATPSVEANAVRRRSAVRGSRFIGGLRWAAVDKSRRAGSEPSVAASTGADLRWRRVGCPPRHCHKNGETSS
jgi:hypothetical protein